MKRPQWLIVAVVVAVVGVVMAKGQMKAQRAPASSASQAKDSAPAKSPLDGARLAECLQSGKPTVADFGKGWCKPCKAMVPVLDAAATRYAGRANVVYVDMEAYPDIAMLHRVMVMPTQVFFDAAGEEVARHEGFMSEQALAAQLASLGVKQ